MKKALLLSLGTLLSVLVFFSACKKDEAVNIFSIQDDIQLGREVTDEILSNPSDYPVLCRNQYQEAYKHLERMRDKVLDNGDVRYRDVFDWDVYIIDQDILNAFALPGGNTFYYTGLIKFLEDEASFMGVMAHEFAHCDRRHSTARLTKVYGLQVLVSILLGNNPSIAAEIAAGLAMGLTTQAFSRSDEYEADEYAVKFINPLEHDSRGVAYFFEKMEIEEGSDWMVYFSTHPHPSDRIDKIYEHWESLGSKEGERHTDRYRDFVNSLP